MATITQGQVESSRHHHQQQQQLSSHLIIGGISILFILILLNPWIIFVTAISFTIGFTGLEHLDRLIKTSILSGRFGPKIQARFKEYIHLPPPTDHNSSSKQEVTEDPLREYLEEEEQKANVQSQQELQKKKQEVALTQAIQNTLAIPGRSSSSLATTTGGSNRSSPSPEKHSRSLLDSPARSLSAGSSRRVSEDIIATATSLVTHHHQTLGKKQCKTPSPSRSLGPSTPSPSKTLKTEVTPLKVDQEFRVDTRVDKCFGRLCTNIINYYISSTWAPYETRKQLKLSLKQLLTSVGKQFNKKLILPKNENVEGGSGAGQDGCSYGFPAVVKLARTKLVPLILHYVDKVISRGGESPPQTSPILTAEERNRVILKIRKFCRQIFERFLIKDDQNCKLWMELCVAVLADGVLVNVMNLGKDKIPELLEEVVKSFKKSCGPSKNQGPRERQESTSLSLPATPKKTVLMRSDPDANSKLEEEFSDPLTSSSEITGKPKDEVPVPPPSTSLIGKESELEKPKDTVPFLLNSFLDPPYNLEKPDQIVSRWRPTLKDIVIETDLLYPLIQYMKQVGGQQSLAYLQGVLDEFPHEGDPYCRRVLELEYLPGFCRSSLLLETMGLDRVEIALEVGATDPFSTIRRGSGGGSGVGLGHTRSASYGGPSTSSFREFLKIEQGIVDGLPLTESSYQNNMSGSSGSSGGNNGAGGEHSEVGSMTGNGGNNGGTMLPGAGAIEPSLAFKRRPHLEMYIAKFIKSTTKSWKQFYDPLAEKSELAKRVGIDAKSYDEWDHPEVNSRVVIKASNSDIYDSLIELVTSLMRNSPVASPFCSGVTTFMKPYLMPIFVSQLENNLSQILSTELLVTVVDLIADVFEENGDNDDMTGTETDQTQSDHVAVDSNRDHGINEEDDTSHHHNSSCTACDPSFNSTLKSFLEHVLEWFMLTFVDLDHCVKCFKQNREYIFLFFVDLLDVLVSEIVEDVK